MDVFKRAFYFTSATHTMQLQHLHFITAPEDFTDTSGTLSISEDGSVECVSITVVNDDEDEEDMECFTFSISTTSTSEDVVLEITQATICIIDNDGTYCAIYHLLQFY